MPASKRQKTDAGAAAEPDSPPAAARIAGLRAAMTKAGVDAYVVGSADAHQSEYVAEHDLRRAWLTGFTGSAGTAVITQTEALLWTDGRYYLQAEKEMAGVLELMKAGDEGVLSVEAWLAEALPAGSKVGVDPWLVSVATARTWGEKLAPAGLVLEHVEGNLVDGIWEEQPPPPVAPVKVHPMKYAGKSVADKLAELRKSLAEGGAAAQILVALDEIAWLFNIRGRDVAYNPVVVSYALVTKDEAMWFVDARKVDAEVRKHLGDAVTIRPYEDLSPAIVALEKSLPPLPQRQPKSAAGGENGTVKDLTVQAPGGVVSGIPPTAGSTSKESKGPAAKIWVDASQVSLAVHGAIPAGRVLEKASPVSLAKACKNDAELEGMRQAHLRDGVALTAFLAWLEEAVAGGEAGDGGGMGWPLTEHTAAVKLEEFRAAQEGYVMPSFGTICGYGPNGGIIHYQAAPETAAAIGSDALLLLDSGGQYLDGTTDVTRTVHLGTPTAHERRAFTLVLKGHIGLAMAVFPEGLRGSKLDVLARTPLWTAGLDYRHGTGHGVGAYLNVHEGPHGISFRMRPQEQGILLGMTTSNEPGYYEDGRFGVRIESVCVCCQAATDFSFGAERYLRLETITMTPLQRSLVDVSLLTVEERKWLNEHQMEVRRKLEPLLRGKDARAYRYLVRETEPL